MSELNPQDIRALIKNTQELSVQLSMALEKIEQDKPKVDIYQKVIDSSKLIDGKELSKVLNIKNVGRNKLYNLLRGMGIYMPHSTEPYQKYIDAGYCQIKIVVCKHGETEKVTLWTTKGLEYLIKQFEKRGFILNANTAN